jgi:hypothetical protein
VLSHQQIEHFRVFGFVVLRRLLDAAEADRLHTEVERSLRDAYGDRYGVDDGSGGITGNYLPVMGDGTFASTLIADDPRLWQASQQLLGGRTVPTFGQGVCFLTNASWHSDDGTDVGGVKFLAHLEPRAAGTGALRVLPGSHHPGLADRIASYRWQDPASLGHDGVEPWPVPGVVLETEPGDVIAFDVHLLHSSEGGRHRLAWSTEFLPCPMLADRDRCRKVRDMALDLADQSPHDYDHERWPVWRDWARNSAGGQARANAIIRLQLLGVLDAPC